MSEPIVERARALVGTRFRPQGRQPAHGLDCVGLVIVASGIDPQAIARDYRLRGDHRARLEDGLGRSFRRVDSSGRRAGDILLVKVAADQFHLAIDAGGSLIHADANLGAVVEVPGEPAWPVLAAYRQRADLTRGS